MGASESANMYDWLCKYAAFSLARVYWLQPTWACDRDGEMVWERGLRLKRNEIEMKNVFFSKEREREDLKNTTRTNELKK